MKVLVIGGGGREHAIVDAISREGSNKIFCAPGNAGIASQAESVNLKTDDVFPLLRFVDDNKIDLTVVGPEQPLAAGLVDAFENRGKKVFGPRKLSARLETSKVFAKEFMRRWKIPTADFRTFTIQQHNELLRYLETARYPLVLKADGLAAGKGVSIVDSVKEAEGELDRLFVKKIFGGAGERVVVEEFMAGTEASIFAITDGKDYLLLPSAQDHKRSGDGDSGKNTGGMGAFAPTPFVSQSDLDVIKHSVIERVLEGTSAEGFPFKGCLYCGMMLTSDGPKVVEFNVRFGDPETQAVLQLVDSSIAELLEAGASRRIASYNLKLNRSAAVCVISASKGYPDYYETGKEIKGLETQSNFTKVLHSGTKSQEGRIVTSGGRVLGIVATDPGGSIKRAAERAYTRLQGINYEGMFYRHDIGKKAAELEERKGKGL